MRQENGGYKEIGAKLFSAVHSARTRSNGEKLEHKDVPSVHQRALLCCSGDTALSQVVQRLGSLLFGHLRKLLGHGPRYISLDVPASTRSGPDGPKSPCQPYPCCDSVIL